MIKKSLTFTVMATFLLSAFTVSGTTIAHATESQSQAITTQAKTAKAKTQQTAAIKALNKLTVRGENNSSYSRAKFKHWIKAGKCNVRVSVLKAEAKGKVTMRGCSITKGKWVSQYDKKTITNPRTLDIDHLVPLKEAWGSGAKSWNSKTRQAYANDLGYKETLIAVTASTNRSKGDKDTAQWMPKYNKCAYASHWVSVKTRWSLSVDTKEKRSLTNTLQKCGNVKFDTPKKAKVTKDTTTHKKKTPAKKKPSTQAKTDPRFRTCTEANRHGYGNYVKGKDVEYTWYQDRDKDGRACE